MTTEQMQERFSRPVSEQELFLGYGVADLSADPYERVLLFRIRELWAHHRWFQRHLGWLHESEQENRAELRHLLRVTRLGRRVQRAAPDPLTAGKGWTDAGSAVAYHDWQARP